MAFYFKTIRSNSSGNCLALRTEKTCVLIDCGLGSQSSCERTLSKHFGQNIEVNAVVVTHTHSDHINYSSLRILEQYGLQLRIHESNIEQLQEKHFEGYKGY